MEASDTEARAVELVFEREQGCHAAFNEIPRLEREQILNDIRARVENIELVTQEIVITKFSESRFKSGRYAFASFALIAVLATIIMVVLSYTQRH